MLEDDFLLANNCAGQPSLTLHGEECLVIDSREHQSPSQHVEERLVQLLHCNPVTVSSTRGRSLCRDRSQFTGPE